MHCQSVHANIVDVREAANWPGGIFVVLQVWLARQVSHDPILQCSQGPASFETRQVNEASPDCTGRECWKRHAGHDAKAARTALQGFPKVRMFRCGSGDNLTGCKHHFKVNDVGGDKTVARGKERDAAWKVLAYEHC